MATFTITDVKLDKGLVRSTVTGRYFKTGFTMPGAKTTAVRSLDHWERSVHLSLGELVSVQVSDRIPFAIMLTRTTEGLRGNGDNVLVSTDINEVYEFLQKNSTTMGFTLQYAVNTEAMTVFEVVRRGRLTKKQIKLFIEKFGITQWVYSWAFASEWFLVDGELLPLTAVFDLSTGADVNDWLHAFYGKTIPNDAGATLKVSDQSGWDRFTKWVSKRGV